MNVDPTIGKWIPVEEGLPTERDWYLGTFMEADTGWINPLPFICEYLLGAHTAYTTDEGWIIRDCTDNDEKVCEYYKKLKCVAWMPLPKPYTELD